MTLDWQTPYRSQRAPLFAQNVVATSQPLAAQAGLSVLQSGGNAIDAALAAAITLTVVEPVNNGIGSDAFALFNDPDQENEIIGLNASGRSPAAWSPEHFRGETSMPTRGWDAVTVPGAVSAWVALSDRYGALPFGSLFESAIRYAHDGYQVGYKTAYYWRAAEKTLGVFDGFRDTFLPDGRAPVAGERITLVDHARTLEAIAASHGDAFYSGVLADAMVDDAKRLGGLLTHDDLTRHQVDWITPISQSFAGVELHEIPPNGQGLMALVALGILEHHDLSRYQVDSVDSVHLQIEATRLGYRDIAAHLADHDHMTQSVETLLDADRLAKLADGLSMQEAHPVPTQLGAAPDTVYLTTADQSGRMVSLIQSNYQGFGSGIVVPGTGISLQNRGAGFSLIPGHPNEVDGRKRPYHTIIPGFVTDAGGPRMSFGVMGGHMQAQGHVQMMVRIFIHGQNPQTASDAPRWHLREDGVVCLEPGFSQSIASALADRGHTIEWFDREYLYGGAQLIYRMDEGYCAGSDHRKEGLAVGF